MFAPLQHQLARLQIVRLPRHIRKLASLTSAPNNRTGGDSLIDPDKYLLSTKPTKYQRLWLKDCAYEPPRLAGLKRLDEILPKNISIAVQ
jgi:hypothetical protein